MVGPNGAGKSTTLHTIMGVLRPSKGSITFEGESLLGKGTDAIARSGLSLVPEGRRIFASMTVKDNLILALSARRGADGEKGTDAILNRFPVLRERFGHGRKAFGRGAAAARHRAGAPGSSACPPAR